MALPVSRGPPLLTGSALFSNSVFGAAALRRFLADLHYASTAPAVGLQVFQVLQAHRDTNQTIANSRVDVTRTNVA